MRNEVFDRCEVGIAFPAVSTQKMATFSCAFAPIILESFVPLSDEGAKRQIDR
jgi:hypothetical protein